jgi:hypothetical protein
VLINGWAQRSYAAEPAYLSQWAATLEQDSRKIDGTAGTTADYRALRVGPGASRWQALLEDLAHAPTPPRRKDKLTLWINAYNILAIDVVLRAYPVESIRDIGSLWSPVWRHEAGTVAGRTVSLHEIEHEILRPMGDPRIHAAIVCASTSCPSLRRSPFTASGLGDQLDLAMRSFLESPTKGLRVDRARKRLTISRIFDWFEDDFAALGGVRATLTRYAPVEDRDWLSRNGDASLGYFDYDWSLNDGTGD